MRLTKASERSEVDSFKIVASTSFLSPLLANSATPSIQSKQVGRMEQRHWENPKASAQARCPHCRVQASFRRQNCPLGCVPQNRLTNRPKGRAPVASPEERMMPHHQQMRL